MRGATLRVGAWDTVEMESDASGAVRSFARPPNLLTYSHCDHQSPVATHVYGDWQTVEPVYPMPPHLQQVSIKTYSKLGLEKTMPRHTRAKRSSQFGGGEGRKKKKKKGGRTVPIEEPLSVPAAWSMSCVCSWSKSSMTWA